MNNIRISRHACEKFIEERGIKTTDHKQVISDIKRLFKKAKKEQIHGGLVKRLIDNEFYDAEYYRYDCWRFVLCDKTMVTLERNRFSKANDNDGYLTKDKTKRDRMYKTQKKEERRNGNRQEEAE